MYRLIFFGCDSTVYLHSSPDVQTAPCVMINWEVVLSFCHSSKDSVSIFRSPRDIVSNMFSQVSPILFRSFSFVVLLIISRFIILFSFTLSLTIRIRSAQKDMAVCLILPSRGRRRDIGCSPQGTTCFGDGWVDIALGFVDEAVIEEGLRRWASHSGSLPGAHSSLHSASGR